MSQKRDLKFDGLRVIGLLAIILAHVGPSAFLFQLRNFDVPLMMLVSGAVYGLSGTKKTYLSYIGGRIARLLVPTWAFLCLFFLLNAAMGKYFSFGTILSSFALLNGIGYVWIVRVFLLVAIISPFFVYLYRRIEKKHWYLLSLLAIFIVYAFMYHASIAFPYFHNVAIVDFIFQNIFFYILPFGCVAGLGIYLLHASKKIIVFLMLLFAGIFGFLAYTYGAHGFVPTQAYKYPPGIYYVSYALAVSLGLYLFSFTTFFQTIFSVRIMQFIAFSSLWVYLWQIFFLYEWSSLRNFLPLSMHSIFVEYVFVIFFSVLFTYLQKRLITLLTQKVRNTFLISALTTAFLK